MAVRLEGGFGWRISNGLPLEFLHMALLWEPVDFIERRALGPSRGSASLVFPSWSWAGWEGAVQYNGFRYSSEPRPRFASHQVVEMELGRMHPNVELKCAMCFILSPRLRVSSSRTVMPSLLQP
jgi:hypothetical protein